MNEESNECASIQLDKKVFSNQTTPLSLEKAYKILTEFDPSKLNYTDTLDKANNGDIYVYYSPKKPSK